MTFIKNISRGHYYEGEAITNFEKVSNSKTEKCGFFLHYTDTRYGSSPDALGPLGILLEVKTTNFVELQAFVKQILGKVPNFSYDRCEVL